MKKQLEHTDSFDKSIYKEMGTTAVREWHAYTDNIVNTNDSIFPILPLPVIGEEFCETEIEIEKARNPISFS